VFVNDLEAYFAGNTGNLIHKWQHYFEIYDRHFARYRGTDVHLLEIGVFQGGSLQMWKQYFGPKARIFGVDINPACKQFEEENVRIFSGDQADREFLRTLAREIPRIDILIDDGGHTMRQQIHTFEELFPHVQENGIYLCEDIHTSYWRPYGGGYHRRGTFIEYSKEFIDSIHAWHSQQPGRLDVTDFTRSVSGLHFYDSILVIEKSPREKPYDVKTGQPRIEIYRPPESSLWKRIARRISGK
jgi:23S rRNA U2552 (ribose-2'-O)-methylase RlmE/FtsJ